MDNQFVAKIIAKLDTSTTATDLKKIEQELNKKGIKLNPVIDTAASKQQMKDYAANLQKILSGLKINVSTADVLASMKQVQREQEKINALQQKNQTATQSSYYDRIIANLKEVGALKTKQLSADTLESQEIQRQITLLEKRNGYYYSQLNKKGLTDNSYEREVNATKQIYDNRLKITQLKAQDKYDATKSKAESAELQKQLALVNSIKTAMSTGKVNTDVSNTTLQYSKLSNITTELQAEFKNLISLQTQLGNSPTHEKLIANYAKFNSALDTVNNKIKQLSNVSGVTKLSDSMEVVKNRANGAEASFQAFQQQLQPSALQKNATEIKSISAAFEKAAKSGNQMDLTKANAQLTAFKGQMKETGMLSRTMFGELANNAKKMASWMVLGGVIASVFRSVREGVQVVKDMESALTNVSYTTGFTASGLEKLGTSSIQMAKDLSTSAKNVLDAVKLYANAKTTVEELIKKSQAAIMLGNVTGLSGEQSAKYLQTIMNQFDMTQDDLMNISDVIQSVSSNIAHDFSKLIAA